MVTAFNIMYSKAAAAMVMCVSASQVMRVQKFAFVAWVWVRGQRPRFVSLSAFKQAFVLRRMKAARPLKAEQWAEVPSLVHGSQRGERQQLPGRAGQRWAGLRVRRLSQSAGVLWQRRMQTRLRGTASAGLRLARWLSRGIVAGAVVAASAPTFSTPKPITTKETE